RIVGAVVDGAEVSELERAGAGVTACLEEAPEDIAERLLDAAQAHQLWVKSSGQRSRAAVFDGQDLRSLGAGLRGMSLSALSARGACLVGLDLSGAELQGANLEAADLRNADLSGADLRGTNLTGANLTKAKLTGARLGELELGQGRSTPTRVEGARLRYAD